MRQSKNGRIIFANLIEPSILEQLTATKTVRQETFLEGMLGRCREADMLVTSGRANAELVHQTRQILRSATKHTGINLDGDNQNLQRVLVYALAPAAEDRAEFARMLAQEVLKSDMTKATYSTVSLIEMILHHFEVWKHVGTTDLAKLVEAFAPAGRVESYMRGCLEGDGHAGRILQTKSALTPAYFGILAQVCEKLHITSKPLGNVPWGAFYRSYWDPSVSDEEAAASIVRLFRAFHSYNMDCLRHALRGESRISTLVIKELAPAKHKYVNEQFEQFVSIAEKIVEDGDISPSRLGARSNSPHVVNEVISDGIARRLFRKEPLSMHPDVPSSDVKYVFKNTNLIGMAAQEGIATHEEWCAFFKELPGMYDSEKLDNSNPAVTLMMGILHEAEKTGNASVFLAGQKSCLSNKPLYELLPMVSWKLAGDKEFPALESEVTPLVRPTWEDIRAYLEHRGGWDHTDNRTAQVSGLYRWMYFLNSGGTPTEADMQLPEFWEAADRIGWQKEEWHKKPIEFWTIFLDLLSSKYALGVLDEQINVLDLIRTAEAALN